MFAIARHQEGICLNPFEFVLNDDGSTKEFASKEGAENFIVKSGFDREDIGENVFVYDLFLEETV